jgi:IS5 family transposase
MVAIRGNEMAKPRDNRQPDLLLPRLDQVINRKHPLVLLAKKIDWQFLDRRFSTVCTPGAG